MLLTPTNLTDEEAVETMVSFMKTNDIGITTHFIENNETGLITHEILEIYRGDYSLYSDPEPLETPHKEVEDA